MKTMKISDHRRVFYDGMKKIHHSRKYSDIILITGGRQFHCHRIILSAFIPGWDRLRYAAPNSKSKFNSLVNNKIDNRNIASEEGNNMNNQYE